MDFIVVIPPAGRPYIRTREYGEPLPEGAAADLSRGEMIALDYFFDARRRFYEVLRARGAAVAERFADELALRLSILNPYFRDIARDSEEDTALLDEAVRDSEEFPDPVCRPAPLPDQIRIVLKDGRAAAYSTYGPEAREPGACDRPLMAQLPAAVWERLCEEPQLEEEVLARVEAGGGEPVAELVEGFIERLYAEDRVDAPFAVRVYSSYGTQAEHIMTGEDDPVPARWAAQRERNAARIAELERRLTSRSSA